MKKLTYGLLSKYKTELMGIASISVLVTHASDTIIVSDLPYIFKIISKIGTLFGSQMYMFFFLSGMGSWFSYDKNKNAITYWKNRVNRTVIPYLLLSFVAYIILDLWLKHDFIGFVQDLTCVSFYTSHQGAWYVAVILIFYMIYPLLHTLSEMNSKIPLALVCGIGVTYLVLANNSPFCGNTVYSNESHWGGVAAGGIAFLFGQYYAKKVKLNQKYNMKSLIFYSAVWIVGEFICKMAPTKVDVLLYMLLGVIGVFIWPMILNKIKSKGFIGLLGKIGRISLELYLTNIYINWLFGEIGSPFNRLRIKDPFNLGRYFCVLFFGILISVIIERYREYSRKVDR